VTAQISAKPFFTVIIATYNAEATIVRSVESVLTQIERPQLVIVDGASSDRTIELLAPYRNGDVEVICERDEGVYDAWNKGLQVAQGEWVIFIGADDYYPNVHCLAALRHHLSMAHPETEIAYGQVHVVNEHGRELSVENLPWEQCSKKLNINMPFTHVGTAHRALMFQRRAFDSAFRIAGDYHFLYGSLSHVLPIHVPEYVVNMTRGGLSTSIKNRLRLLAELQRVRKIYNIPVPAATKIWTLIKIFIYNAIKLTSP